jgi:hypothetical protein
MASYKPKHVVAIIKVFYLPTDAQVNCLKNNFKIAKASSDNALPDQGDCTETCRSCFNVNFNVHFKTVFKTIHLCISWWIKKFHNIKMLHGMYVEKM